MWRRQSKVDNTERNRQRLAPRSGGRSAFSYHANRILDRGEEENLQRKVSLSGVTERPRARGLLAQLPFWIVMGLAVVCAGKLLLLGTTPKVSVVGQTTVTSSYFQDVSIYQKAASKLLAKSPANRVKLTLDSNGIAREMEKQFPELESVSVVVPLLGNRPIVYVMPASPSLVLQTPTGENYAVNASGVVLAQVSTLPDGVFLLRDQTGVVPKVGGRALPASTISFIRSVTYQLKAAQLAVASLTLPQASTYELDVQLEGKPYIVRFNLLTSAKQQSGALVAALPQVAAASSYIDLRVPERLYFK